MWCGDFAPAGDLLSWASKKVGKEAAPAAPSLGYEGSPAMLESRGRPELASLRSAQTSGASQKLKRASARLGILCFSAAQKGSSRHPLTSVVMVAVREREARTARQRRSVPLWLRREAQRLATRAYSRASITDSRRLFEQSVAPRVRRGRKARASQGTPRTRGAKTPGSLSLLPFFVDTKKGGRPRGRNPRIVEVVQPLRICTP